MQYSGKTFLLITVLISIALFLTGFRLGKKVEMIDKNYVAPTVMPPTSAPTIAPTEKIISFKSLHHDGCGISFLYPNNLSILVNSSSEAALVDKNRLGVITVKCDIPQATRSARLIPSPTIVSLNNRTFSIHDLNEGVDEWSVKNPNNGKVILFTTIKNLTNLVMRTLEFTRKTP